MGYVYSHGFAVGMKDLILDQVFLCRVKVGRVSMEHTVCETDGV